MNQQGNGRRATEEVSNKNCQHSPTHNQQSREPEDPFPTTAAEEEEWEMRNKMKMVVGCYTKRTYSWRTTSGELKEQCIGIFCSLTRTPFHHPPARRERNRMNRPGSVNSDGGIRKSKVCVLIQPTISRPFPPGSATTLVFHFLLLHVLWFRIHLIAVRNNHNCQMEHVS